MEQFKTLNQNRDYVRVLQQQAGAVVDGFYGPATHNAIKAFYGMPVMIHMGKVIPIDSPLNVNLSASLYELDDGTKNWYERKKDPSTICVHWGGLNTRHCYNVFNMARGRHVSSHFLIGKNHKTNEYELLQCLDTGLVAYHAGKFNKHSIGVDICMHPQKKYWEKTKKWYPDAFLSKYDGDDKRVPKDEIAMIGPEFSTLCRQFLHALTAATGLDNKPICEDNNVYPVNDAAKFSIVGHHNISAKKWDVIPWAQSLYYSIDC
jgi:hypothetical protein